MRFLTRCPRPPGVSPDLFLSVALNAPSQNQNQPGSKGEKQSRVPPSESTMWTPEQSPYPGIQGLRSSGFSSLIAPCSLCPATESLACSISYITRVSPLPDHPSQTSSARETPVQPQRLTTELLPCQSSLAEPLWGESESLSPALPWASGAFRHPSIYSLFKSGAPGHVAGREGRAPGWENRFCNLPGEGLGFSRTTPLAHDPLIPPHSSVSRGDGAPTPAAALRGTFLLGLAACARARAVLTSPRTQSPALGLSLPPSLQADPSNGPCAGERAE